MGLRRALDLRDLHQRLVAHALLGIRRIEGPALILRAREHQAPAPVRVVRDCERIHAPGALGIEPGPEVFRIGRVVRAERHGRHFGAREDHVAVEVREARHRGVLVRDERREASGFVVAFGGLDRAMPRVPYHGLGVEFGARPPPCQGIREHGDHRRYRVVHAAALRQRVFRIGQRGQHAEVLRVVGDRDEVQRPAREPDRIAQRMGDRRALAVAVRVVRRRPYAAHAVGVDGVRRVHVEFAEPGAARGRGGRGLLGGCRSQERATPNEGGHRKQESFRAHRFGLPGFWRV